ncbi:CAP domain-containing protein [Deinococcus marmoris]|uniref:Transporter n=1 Tax=Deinococcus marmoris TaxID=249408 RepID=A0A1U7NV83_9DEIO|nr:CAP domain-containing protein [Deinococcus marmoris]OLV16825.1 Transporter [Deinococcus marmoris]
MRFLPFIVLGLSVLTLAACAPRTARTTVIPGPVQTEVRPMRLGVGQDIQLEVTLNGRNVPPNELNWTSSDPRVVSVSASGLARAATAGQASVRATQTGSGRTLAEFRVQVAAPPPATPQRLDTMTGQVLELSNAARARGQTCGAQNFPPVPPLNSEARLGAAAQAHAADMAALNYFSHTSQDGRTLKNRIDAAGYGWRAIAENIAAGQASAQEVVTGWLNSEGHCRNLMNAEYRELGIGLARNAGGKLYWVQDFGTR